MNLARIRGFLQLTQREVENGSGVPAYRLGKAERGMITLNNAEQTALRNYYVRRWKMVFGNENIPRAEPDCLTSAVSDQRAD